VDDLIYSIEAQNVLNLFYSADYMVYVEGKDDIPFWEHLFSRFYKKKVEVQDVGCSTALIEYMENIISNKLDAIVACDSDFNAFNTRYKHNKIIRTYGYSIENSLICKQTVIKVIKSLAKIPTRKIPLDVINTWFEHFDNSTKKLILFDMYNHFKELGVCVTGDNCTKFLKSNKSAELCLNKINAHIEKIGFDIDDEFITSIQTTLAENDRAIHHYIRGHFLFSAIAKLVSIIVRTYENKASISNDALFSALILAFESVLTEEHPHFKYYESTISNISSAA